MQPRNVTIVILTWNGVEYTRRCLETLRRMTSYANYHVLVADNGSSDGTLEYLESLPWVTLLRNGANLGFVRGNNAALRTLPADHDVILLNNDTEILHADWIEQLQKSAYQAEDVGVVGCRLVNPDGLLMHTGTYIMPETWWGQQIGGGEQDCNQYAIDRDVEGVVFACVYLKRQVLDDVGLLDEDFFSYFEDTDYCLKARVRGYRTVCSGGATVMHHQNVSTAINGVSHSGMFTTSMETFRGKWEGYFKNVNDGRYQHRLDWHSLINLPSGYAISSRRLIETLEDHGVRMAYRYLYGPDTDFNVIEPRALNSHRLECIRQRPFNPDGVQVVYGLGNAFKKNDAAYRIGYTMLETTGIPQEWVRQSNEMDEVWVPSHFNLETFRACGVTAPMHVIPLGIDPAYFNPGVKGYRDEAFFTFLSVCEWGDRKGSLILMQAFHDEFSEREEAVLVFKILSNQPPLVVHDMQQLRRRPNGGRIVMSLNDRIPTYQLASLYRSSDCFVSSTRGEGWGMPILEAMACGLPVIATNWSAQTDFFNERNGYPIEVEKLVPATGPCPFYEGFKWAEPSYEHLRTLLRQVYENRQEARRKGEIAAQEALSGWTWDHSARKIIQRLEQIELSRPGGRGRFAAAASNVSGGSVIAGKISV